MGKDTLPYLLIPQAFVRHAHAPYPCTYMHTCAHTHMNTQMHIRYIHSQKPKTSFDDRQY